MFPRSGRGNDDRACGGAESGNRPLRSWPRQRSTVTEDGPELRVRFWEYRGSGTCDILHCRPLVQLHDTFQIQIATEHEQANVLLTAEIMNRGFGLLGGLFRRWRRRRHH